MNGNPGEVAFSAVFAPPLIFARKPNPIKILVALVSFTIGVCMAADSGEALAEPQTFLKIVTAIESSKIDCLTSKKDEQGTSYHLRRTEFLGTVNRADKTYTIAHAVFVRSSPPGRDTPPARGHDFIVVFGPDFKICGVGRTSLGEYYMEGEKLYLGSTAIPQDGLV